MITANRHKYNLGKRYGESLVKHMPLMEVDDLMAQPRGDEPFWNGARDAYLAHLDRTWL